MACDRQTDFYGSKNLSFAAGLNVPLCILSYLPDHSLVLQMHATSSFGVLSVTIGTLKNGKLQAIKYHPPSYPGSARHPSWFSRFAIVVR